MDMDKKSKKEMKNEREQPYMDLLDSVEVNIESYLDFQESRKLQLNCLTWPKMVKNVSKGFKDKK